MANNNPFVRFGTSNMVLPPDGPAALPYRLDMATGLATQDLVIPIQNGSIDRIQTMYVDNGSNAAALTVRLGDSGNGQRIIVPPLSQGYFAILFNDSDSKTTFSTTPLVGLIIPVYFINVPIQPGVWKVT